MSETIASAAILPEDSIDVPCTGLKRKQSEVSEREEASSGKRQRTSPGKSSPTAAPTQEATETSSTAKEASKPDNQQLSPKAKDPRESRRKIGVTDEKQRSKRLFGALLGNLNRPSDGTTKRRGEIEARRKAELQKQDDERLEDRQKRLEKLTIQRKKAQVKVDEQSMHVRQNNFLETSNMLRTKTEPMLYYRPWDLLSDEEDCIGEQIKEAKALIEKELSNWEVEKKKRLDALSGEHEAPTNGNGDGKPAENHAQLEADSTDEAQIPNDTDKQNEAEAEIDPPAAGLDSDSKTAVDSERKPPDVHGNGGTEGKPDEVAKQTDSAKRLKTEEQEQEEAEAEAEDEGDHVVEGDEDTAIY